MHEYSVVSSLIDLCQHQVTAHNAREIIKITIEVGERSGVEMTLLKSAFDVLKEESDVCKNSSLEIVYKKILLYCEDCNINFSAVGLEYGICPYCNSNNVSIIEGKELHLLSIEME